MHQRNHRLDPRLGAAGVPARREVLAAGSLAPGSARRTGSTISAGVSTTTGTSAGMASTAAGGSPVSIVSRASPSSSSGTFHWNASSRPLTGDTGIQRSETKPSAVQAGSLRGVQRPRHPFARAAFVAAFALLDLRHQHGDALGRRP